MTAGRLRRGFRRFRGRLPRRRRAKRRVPRARLRALSEELGLGEVRARVLLLALELRHEVGSKKSSKRPWRAGC